MKNYYLIGEMIKKKSPPWGKGGFLNLFGQLIYTFLK